VKRILSQLPTEGGVLSSREVKIRKLGLDILGSEKPLSIHATRSSMAASGSEG